MGGIAITSEEQILKAFKVRKDHHSQGAWVAPSVKRRTLGFSAGQDLGVLGSEPQVGPTISTEPQLACTLSLSNK